MRSTSSSVYVALNVASPTNADDVHAVVVLRGDRAAVDDDVADVEELLRAVGARTRARWRRAA